jgi:peroxiredoxin
VKLANELAEGSTNQAPDLALAAYLCWQAGDTNAATRIFKQLRAISARFDLEAPILARLTPIAESSGLPQDWRVSTTKKKDVGKRPTLDSLGPFRWEPYTAPDWKLADARNKQISLAECKGRPVLVVFYLGRGCTHCLEQLSLLADAAKDFDGQGIRIVAVSTDGGEALQKSTSGGKMEFPFPIVSDKSLKTFKAYRAYDDFEQMPLHATFLIDGYGKVRWQDISFDPFTGVKFLLAESKRLLKLGTGAEVATK